MELTGDALLVDSQGRAVAVAAELGFAVLCFWSLVWQMEPIPSPTFQYAQTYWHLIALRQCLWYSATLGGETLF